MKKIYIYLMIAIVMLITTTGCDNSEKNESLNKKNSKLELYRIDVENIGYFNEKLITYKLEDSAGNRILLMITGNDAEDCSYFQTEKYTGKLIQTNFKTCSYSVKENNITLDISANKLSVDNPDTSYEHSSNEIVSFTITGKFHETGKNLIATINGSQYELVNSTYQKIKEMGLEKALVDPKTSAIYDLDGLSIWGHGENNQKESLDLSQYDIKDMEVDHSPWNTNR